MLFQYNKAHLKCVFQVNKIVQDFLMIIIKELKIKFIINHKLIINKLI